LLASAGTDRAGIVWDVTGRFRDGRFSLQALAEMELKQREDDLASADASTAFQAIQALAGSPGNAVRLLQEQMQRQKEPVEVKVLAKLVADLDSDEFARREEATRRLARLSLAAEPALREVMQGALSLEARRRLEQVLRERAESTLLWPSRALETLEQIATPEARQLVQKLVDGALGANLTREAKAALGRMSK
jgi:hypothetical protein